MQNIFQYSPLKCPDRLAKFIKGAVIFLLPEDRIEEQEYVQMIRDPSPGGA